MRTRQRWATALIAAALWPSAGAPAAHAYCRTTTVPVLPDFQPRPDRCWTQGAPLFWRNACVAYSVQRNGSKQIAFEDAADAIAAAFTRWTAASCPNGGGGRSRVGIDVRDLGPVDCARVDYNQVGPNQNVIVFRDDHWPHSDASNTLALTTVTFHADTGEIYDGDMEINTAEARVTLTDPVPADGYDFASIVTHETGHFLGLAHSGEVRATMFASYTPGNTAMRNLTADDVAGICSIYRPDGTRVIVGDAVTEGPQCDPTPRRGFTGACAAPSEESCLGSSSIAARRPASNGWIGAGLGTALLLVVRARRRREARG